ncbi:hypothetical protein Ae201684P_003995 [Aphanomyces euteiches]|nr:hypothetical protein Ae201684P_003995 [Aphanomyces euteiches]
MMKDVQAPSHRHDHATLRPKLQLKRVVKKSDSRRATFVESNEEGRRLSEVSIRIAKEFQEADMHIVPLYDDEVLADDAMLMKAMTQNNVMTPQPESHTVEYVEEKNTSVEHNTTLPTETKPKCTLLCSLVRVIKLAWQSCLEW